MNVKWSDVFIDTKTANIVADTLKSGWISGGPGNLKLQHAIGKHYKVKNVLCVSNGTLALQLAMQALNLKPKDEVILPGFCFNAAANVIIQMGGKPIFCDVSKNDWNVKAKTICEKITAKTVGIVVVYNLGHTTDISNIKNLATKNNLWVVEDCAEAWFSKSNNELLGTFGDIATFSMHATKTVSCGEGGVILWNKDIYTKKIKLIQSHGLDRSNGLNYHHEIAGNNYRLSNILGELGLRSFQNKAKTIKKQHVIHNYYKAKLEDFPLIAFPKLKTGDYHCIWHTGIKLRLEKLLINNFILVNLMANRGIELRTGFKSVSKLSYFKKTGYLPVSDQLSESSVILPFYGSITKKQVSLICDVLKCEILKFSKQNFKNCKFKRVSNSNIKLLKAFLSNINLESKMFRYYNHRPVDVISNHKITLIACVNNISIGYGHIDFENGNYWLGICVKFTLNNKGYGSLIMAKLILEALKMKIEKLVLCVDKINKNAVKLYQKFGFKTYMRTKTRLYMELKLWPDFEYQS